VQRPVPRYCELIDPHGPKYRPAYGQTIIAESHRLATKPASESDYPSVARQALNLAGAVGRVAGAAVTGNAVTVSDQEQDRRLALCRDCERFNAGQGRCRECGCLAKFKAMLKTERCPLTPPKW
jgi:hypothetical protein